MSANLVIKRLTVMFGAPNTPEPDHFFEEYHRALVGLDADLLTKAADQVILKSVYWPRPGEIFAEYQRLARERDWWRERKAAGTERPEPTAKPEKRDAAWQARQDAIMAEFRATMSAIAGERGPTNDIDWERGQRPGFLRMQRESPNGMHRRARP